MEIKIAVAYHKPSPLLTNPVYLPIHVGKRQHPEIELGIQGDDAKDNISDENIYYCELTALYWLWKNVKADIKGLFHYRRILDLNNPFSVSLKRIRSIIMGREFRPNITYSEEAFLKSSEKIIKNLPKLMGEFDILCPDPATVRPTVLKHFSIIGQEYVDILREAVHNVADSYDSSLEKVLTSNRLYFGNLTVMKSYIFDNYCEFVFSILNEVKRILINDGYLKDLKTEKIFNRKLGYLGEILTCVFLFQNKSIYKIKQLRVGNLR